MQAAPQRALAQLRTALHTTLARPTALPAARLPPSSPSPRLLHTTAPTHARAKPRAASGKPKRDETLYGKSEIHRPALPREQWPKREETDTSNHPLWRFFHDQVALEVPDKAKDMSGRAWRTEELRIKSFEDLHKLWYILLRERNVLLTQKEEARRVSIDLRGFSMVHENLHKCRKSMARIKGVLAERRNAALQAAQILREREDAIRNARLEEHRARSEAGRKRQREKAQRSMEALLERRKANKGRRARARAAAEGGAAKAQEAKPAAQVIEPGTGGLTETFVEEQGRVR
ncbi:54S ribosomal protein L4 [Rhodotorula toruloides]|uniref:Large ribosomal subunit protein uL29m n=1 Tax=Rhodotorula toruloides TaxID=5286 RepID=A0A511KKS1_RHOTO|nr:54S ribosomal protein L4 [Rhodotorula toruloides]